MWRSRRRRKRREYFHIAIVRWGLKAFTQVLAKS
jgi:hypothetical protein